MDTLPSVPLANVSQIKCQDIIQTSPLPILTVDYMLYVPSCLFNLVSICKLTHTLFYSVTFAKKIVLVQDQGTGMTIRAGHESQGLYYLSEVAPPIACSTIHILLFNI